MTGPAADGPVAATRPDAVRLAALQDEPLSVDAVLAAVAGPGVGGTALFVGSVRDHDHGRQVTALRYSAHPTAVDRLRRVLAEVAAAHDVPALAAVHRLGELAVGELAVVVAAGAAHRGAAFAACRAAIDTLKREVPVWKEQQFADGGSEWVGLG